MLKVTIETSATTMKESAVSDIRMLFQRWGHRPLIKLRHTNGHEALFFETNPFLSKTNKQEIWKMMFRLSEIHHFKFGIDCFRPINPKTGHTLCVIPNGHHRRDIDYLVDDKIACGPHPQ